MKHIIISIFVLITTYFSTTSQIKEIKVSDKLVLTKLTENTFVHTSESSNGLVYNNSGEAIIISTPPTDKASTELINWVKDTLKTKIVGFIIDSWHPDNMEGLDIVTKFGIKSYSNETTRQIAKNKGLPVPQVGFTQKLEIPVGKAKVVCQYFGPAHTSDGIMVWIPDEKVLFGNNGVRNNYGWIGNVGDANLDKWSETISKAKATYPDAKYVVPGHGNYGGTELLDYTINLYKPSFWGKILKKENIKPGKIFIDYGKYFVIAQSDSIIGNIQYLKNAIVFFDKGDQYVMVESPIIKHIVENKSIESEFGRIKILNKDSNFKLPETDGYYKTLSINLRDDAVGMTIIMKEFIY